MDYKLLIKQTESIIQPDIPLVSNLANVAAILNQLEDINWCGFYLGDILPPLKEVGASCSRNLITPS